MSVEKVSLKKENIVEKNKEKVNENIDKFKRLMKSKKGVKMLGFVFVAMGFVMGYVGGIVVDYNQALGNSFATMGEYVMIIGFIFIIYLFIGFNNKKDKPKTEKEQEKELIEEIISSTELLSQESVLDDIETSIENTTEDVENISNKEED